jgi:DNA-directed RNA polymerase subunit RPC12/RpoP
MALEKCSDCGTEVSPKAMSCPKCGRVFQKTLGHRVLVLFLVLAGLFLLITLLKSLPAK